MGAGGAGQSVSVLRDTCIQENKCTWNTLCRPFTTCPITDSPLFLRHVLFRVHAPYLRGLADHLLVHPGVSQHLQVLP